MDIMIFRAAARYPVDPRAVFILALSVFSGALALTLHVGPESLEVLLPKWAVITWGLVLSVGSAVTLLGMAFQTVWGVILEQIGSATVGAATIFYSTLAFYVIGTAALQGTMIILAWGLASFVRWGQLQVLINNAVARQRKEEVVQRLAAELEKRREQERRARGGNAR